MSVTYLLGIGELADPAALARLRVDAPLGLRYPLAAPGTRHGRYRVEVCTPDGRRLGYLPPDGTRAVEDLLQAGVPARARVVALVPCFGRSRVQLEIEPAGAAESRS